MTKKTIAVRIALSLGLIASAAVGTRILTTDRWLWASAPTHAYGLIAFVAIDMVLAMALFLRVKYASLGASTLAVVQFVAMAGDTLVGSPSGASASAFQSYLLGNTYFTALLSIQPAIVGLGFWTRKTSPEVPRKVEGD